MPLPVTFRNTGENIIASYDWYDAGLGAGYKKFYAACSVASGAAVASTSAVAQYYLTSQPVDSDYEQKSLSVNDGTSEVDFDLEFQNPQIVKGEALVNYSVAQNTGTTHTTFTFYHVNLAGTETQIGQTLTSDTSEGEAFEVRRLAKITLAKTHFAIGEKLRINVSFFTNATTATIWFDPGSRETLTEGGGAGTIVIGTDMTIYIPFRIDL